MKEQDRKGIAFGFAIAITWLVLLTGFIMCDKMSTGHGVRNVILPPPMLEPIEVDIEIGGLYE